ncbi:hybrid sensor histidine kinase/response regulator [Bradyrhizobium sp. Y36]|uniref:ATP-binding protein n=1 Tax=Bradyrhizobium sp. Y36 TaxID=2035447 RepID=UPI000BE8C000|nr:ATP-binding protein [Bradyrhizobium sp. Y36]PDT88751.1 hybrid sensor histidine kinase/response regulator [Bradyrhizobium sp. Y36]
MMTPRAPLVKASSHLFRRQKRAVLAFLPMVAAALLMVFAIIAAQTTIWHLHARADRETQAGLNRIALILADQTSRSFQAADLVLKDASDRIDALAAAEGTARPQLGGEVLHDYLVDKVKGLPQVANLILIGADGIYANSGREWPVARTSFAHREQFRYHRDRSDGGLFVSEPVKNTYDGAWTIYLARRLAAADGQFAGVVQAAVRLNYFEKFYASVALGEGGSISLRRDDGTVLAHHPWIEGLVGSRPAGHAAASETLDDPARYVAVRRVPDFPLVVSTALTKEAVLGSWRQDATTLAVGTLGALFAVVLLLCVLYREMRNLRRSEVLLEGQNMRLESSERLLLDAQRIGRLGHWFADPARRDAIWSPQMFEIAGIETMESVPFEKFASLLHPEDAGAFLAAHREARLNSEPFTHEHRWLRPDGTVRWVRFDSDPQFGPDGNVTGTLGTVQDITDRKEAERAAEESRARLFDAIESVSQGFIMYDNEDRFVLANGRFQEMFPQLAALLVPGMRYEEILRIGWQFGLFGEMGADFEQWRARMLAWHGTGEPIENRYPDGRWIQFVDHRTSDGGVAGIRTDITEFKQVQAALEQKLKDLEKSRAELEAQKQELVVTSQDLVKARDSAEQLSKAKSEFLAIMSHEIRSPLSGMVGMIELLRDTQLNEEQERYAKLAKESSDSLLSVINDILDFSKLEAGRISTERVDFDVLDLVNGVAMLQMPKARDKGVDLEVIAPTELPSWLSGDPTRLRQILLNLVNNAVKFTERGRIIVTVSHRELAAGELELRVEVADTGIGIEAQQQSQLFTPFVQADTSISRKYGGSGLGLAICKKLCAMMRGAIGVQSTLGQGSTFWFTVICSLGNPNVSDAPPLVPLTGETLDILVAEDSPIIATLISTLLRKRGFCPDMVKNGLEAVDAVSRKNYDIVLMDVNMPEMDGMSAARAIRSLPGTESCVPIVGLTANVLAEQRDSYLAAGMNDYVSKPIRPDALFSAIERWAVRADQLGADHGRSDLRLVQ